MLKEVVFLFGVLMFFFFFCLIVVLIGVFFIRKRLFIGGSSSGPFVDPDVMEIPSSAFQPVRKNKQKQVVCLFGVLEGMEIMFEVFVGFVIGSGVGFVEVWWCLGFWNFDFVLCHFVCLDCLTLLVLCSVY